MVETQVRHGTGETTIAYPKFPFEGIFSGDGDGDDRYVCFLCNRIMEKGEAFTCVSRLLETCEGNEVKPSVIEAVASLQICLPCTLLSAHHRLKWVHNPKLTGFELCSFYAYTKLLAKTMGRLKSDTRVQKEFVEHLIGGIAYLPVKLDRAALQGGIHDIAPVMITDDRCQRCYDTINSSKPHMVFEISTNIPRHKTIEQSNIWRLGKYCNECSNQLLPLCSRLW